MADNSRPTEAAPARALSFFSYLAGPRGRQGGRRSAACELLHPLVQLRHIVLGFRFHQHAAQDAGPGRISLHGSVRPTGNERRFSQARGLATLAAFAVNVVTI